MRATVLFLARDATTNIIIFFSEELKMRLTHQTGTEFLFLGVP